MKDRAQELEDKLAQKEMPKEAEKTEKKLKIKIDVSNVSRALL